MNRKIIFTICIALVLLFTVFTFKKKFSNTDTVMTTEVDRETDRKTTISKDEETGEYVVYDKNTGDEIARSFEENDLYIYEIDPEFNPKRPESVPTDILAE